mmetsp:Transcript_8431/g.23961  ORF Transcript_8431/g.23961 Transcript_8431/m.23961 type:complete len:210 (+) Transcript_8431:153-782(+)
MFVMTISRRRLASTYLASWWWRLRRISSPKTGWTSRAQKRWAKRAAARSAGVRVWVTLDPGALEGRRLDPKKRCTSAATTRTKMRRRTRPKYGKNFSICGRNNLTGIASKVQSWARPLGLNRPVCWFGSSTKTRRPGTIIGTILRVGAQSGWSHDNGHRRYLRGMGGAAVRYISVKIVSILYRTVCAERGGNRTIFFEPATSAGKLRYA